jgi:hypothetical protein
MYNLENDSLMLKSDFEDIANALTKTIYHSDET